jgi:hypothetical protein
MQCGKPQNTQLGKKTYVDQEIEAIMQHAGKSKKRALEAVKTEPAKCGPAQIS